MITVNRRAALLAPLPLLVSGPPALAQTAPASDVAAASNYISRVLTIGALSTRHSTLALQRGTDPLVRGFAQLELDEQKAVASVLAATGGTDEKTELSTDQQAILDHLAGTANGELFDLSYVESQISLHNELLAAHQTMSGQRDPSVSAITARIAAQATASHIAALNLIQQLIGARHIQQVDQMQDQPVPGTPEPSVK